MNVLNKLKNELINDPEGIGYSGMDDKTALNSLNTKNRTKQIPIPSTELLAWAGGNSRYMKLKKGAEDATKSDAIRSICYAALEMIKRDGTAFDFNLTDRQTMLNTLVAAGVLDSSDKTALQNLATKSISRAEELGLGKVRLGTIQQARA